MSHVRRLLLRHRKALRPATRGLEIHVRAADKGELRARCPPAPDPFGLGRPRRAVQLCHSCPALEVAAAPEERRGKQRAAGEDRQRELSRERMGGRAQGKKEIKI